MNHAQANRHIAELNIQIVRQRVIIKDALDTGQRFEMAESLLDALEGSLRLFEKAPDTDPWSVAASDRPSSGSSKRPTRDGHATGITRYAKWGSAIRHAVVDNSARFIGLSPSRHGTWFEY
jgi:hypothetical protein